MVLGVMAALGLVVVIPNLSVEYGVLRAFQQTLLVVAPVMAAGMWALLRPLGRHAATLAAALAAAVPVGLLLVLSGVLPTLLGGHQARLALENSGLYHDRYVAADSDVTSMAWLAAGAATTGARRRRSSPGATTSSRPSRRASLRPRSSTGSTRHC